MLRREFNFALALAASVALHVLFFAGPAKHWGWLVGNYSNRANKPQEVAIALQDPDASPAESKPKSKEEIPPDMGEAAGVGVGSNKSEGPDPLNAREADEDQALLSRDPRGPGRLRDEPVDFTGPLGENGKGGQRGASTPSQKQETVAIVIPPAAPPAPAAVNEDASLTPPTPPIQLTPVTDQPIAEPSVAVSPQPKLDPALPRPAPPAEHATPQARVIVAAVLPNKAAQRPQTGDGLAPGADLHQGNPAQQSDSESDAFSRIGSVVFRDGKLEVRQGRKVKTTRPRVLLSGQVDLYAMGGATVVLKVSIDATGKVTAVDVLHSSGRNDIDQPCRVAVYDWWFEPSRDKKGNPVADTFPFTIQFQQAGRRLQFGDRVILTKGI